MSEEYGYQRSGKKCKEKFENLYKYYKKTKGGKSGRQDGKHYRFFRQLEAICGESSSTTTNITTTTTTSADNNNNYHQPPLMTFTDNGEVLIHDNIINNNNSSDQLETSSSEYHYDNNNGMSVMSYMMMMKKQKQVMEIDQKRERVMRKSLRVEVEEIVESHMRNIIETQEAWMEKMMSVVENREQEMVYKEEERMRDSVRLDQQVHQLWAKERAWIATRDTALMEVVKEHLGKEELTTNDHLLQHQPMVFEGYEEEELQSRNNIVVGGQNWSSQIYNLK